MTPLLPPTLLCTAAAVMAMKSPRLTVFLGAIGGEPLTGPAGHASSCARCVHRADSSTAVIDVQDCLRSEH